MSPCVEGIEVSHSVSTPTQHPSMQVASGADLAAKVVPWHAPRMRAPVAISGLGISLLGAAWAASVACLPSSGTAPRAAPVATAATPKGANGTKGPAGGICSFHDLPRTPPKDARRRRALLVGIESYEAPRKPKLETVDEWPDLRGPGNDLRAVGSFLHEQGFDVRCLFDAEATKANVLSAFRSHLIEGVRGGRPMGEEDVALFYFSGHGQQIPDDVDRDEVDGFDEALVPFDHRGSRDHQGHIRDDELRALVAEVEAKTRSFAVILDSCHSGSATRGPLASRGKEPSGEPVLHPPLTNGKFRRLQGHSRDYGGPRTVVLSAARAYQPAREHRTLSGDVYGAFTYLLVDALRRASGGGRIAQMTYGDLVREVSARLPGLGLDQEPLLEGEASQVLFSGALLPRPPSFELDELEISKYTRLRGGSVHGLSTGAVLALFEPGVDIGRASRDEMKTAPRVAVREVRVAVSFVEPVDDSGKPLSGKPRRKLAERFERGAQAVVVEQPSVADLLVRVDVHREAVAKAIDTLREDGVAIALAPKKANEWDLSVERVTSDKEETCGADASPRPVVILATNGEPLPIPVGKGRPPRRCFDESAAGAAKVIEQALRAHQVRTRLLALAPAFGEPGLSVALKVQPLGQLYKGGRCAPDPSADAKEVGPGQLVMAPGSCFRLAVKSSESRPVFVSVLAIDPDLSITALFPDEDATDDRLEPGASPTLPGTFFTEPPGGKTIFKLIATTERVNTRMLEFSPMGIEEQLARTRGARRGASSALQQLLLERGAGVRSASGRVPDLEPWGTATAELSVRE